MNKFVYILISVLLIAGIGMAGNPIVSITTPTNGTYLNNGSQDITFTVTDSDNPSDVNAIIYYSTSAGTKNNKITTPDLNLSDTGCTSTNFTTGPTCTYSWTLLGVGDGNYFIDIEVFDLNTPDSVVASSSSFMIDNSAPTITISTPQDGNTNYTSNLVEFDVNKNGSPIDISTITVTLVGNSTDFSTSNCTNFDGEYHCSYNETNANTNGTAYTLRINASDLAGNAATQTESDFTFVDGDSPEQVTGLTGTAGDGQVSLSWTASSASDLNAYFIYKSTTSGFTADSSTLIGTTTSTTYSVTSLTNATTYYFKVRADDTSGNLGTASDQVNAAPQEVVSNNLPTGTPTISSNTHDESDWESKDDVTFSWTTISNIDAYRYEFNESSGTIIDNDDSSNGASTALDFEKNDGIYWFHIAGCNSYGCGPTDHYKIMIDKTGPDAPKNLFGLSHSDGSIYLNWDEPDDNPEENNSGIKEYIIYRSITRDFEINESGVKEFDGITDTDYTDEYSLIQGVAYYYRIQAIDELENPGTVTSIKRVLNSGNSCGIELIANIPEIVKKGELKIDIITSEGTIYNAKLKIKMPGEKFETLKTGQNGSSIIDDYEIKEGIKGTASIIVEGYDENDKSCEQLFEFEVDSINPEIEIISPKNNAEISEKITIQVSATDEGTSIEKIEAFVNDISIGELEKSGAFYELEWSSTKNKNGDYKLKLEAEDKAGNTSEKEIIIKINNIKGTLFAEEEKTFDNVDSATLKNAGLKQELLNEAMTLIKENAPKRKFTAQQTTNGIEVKLTITLKNTGSTKTMSLIEVIRKTLVQNAGLIISNKAFKVLQEDPVIQFNLGEVTTEEEVIVSYTIASGLSTAEASELEKVFSEFNVSPILLETQIESPIIAGSNSDNLWLIFLVITVIFLLIVGGLLIGGGALFFHQKSKKQTIQSKGLHTVYDNKSNDGFFSDLFKKGDSEKKGKFAYKK